MTEDEKKAFCAAWSMRYYPPEPERRERMVYECGRPGCNNNVAESSRSFDGYCSPICRRYKDKPKRNPSDK